MLDINTPYSANEIDLRLRIFLANINIIKSNMKKPNNPNSKRTNTELWE